MYYIYIHTSDQDQWTKANSKCVCASACWFKPQHVSALKRGTMIVSVFCKLLQDCTVHIIAIGLQFEVQRHLPTRTSGCKLW